MRKERAPSDRGNEADRTSSQHQSVMWHPNVHHYFGERLHYFLIEMADYLAQASGHSPVSSIETIHSLLHSQGALGHCVYEVFGDVDVLVRVWLDSERYDKLLNTFRQERSIVEVTPFQCEREDYLWARLQDDWEDIQPDFIAKKTVLIETAVRQLKSGERLDVTTLKQLQTSHLIIKEMAQSRTGGEPNIKRRPIKFFSFLKIPGRLVSQPRSIVERVHRKLGELKVAVKDKELSFYFGLGPHGNNCLIKGLAFDYYDVYRIVVSGFSDLGLEQSPHTYLVASSNWHECDDLAPGIVTGDLELKQIFAFANVPFERIAGLPRDDARTKQLEKAYESLKPLLAQDDEEGFLPTLVYGLLDRDARTVKMGATFLFDIEMLMKQFFLDALEKAYPNQQVNKLYNKEKDLCEEERQKLLSTGKQTAADNLYVPNSLNKASLKDFGVMLGRLCEKAKMNEILGPDWCKDIERTTEIRNAVAHGRIDEEIGGNLIENWAEFIRRLAPALHLYYKLRRHTERQVRAMESAS